MTTQKMIPWHGDNYVNQSLGVRKPWSVTAFDHNKYIYENNGLSGALRPCAQEGDMPSRPRHTSPALRDSGQGFVSVLLCLPARKAHPDKSCIPRPLTQKDPTLTPSKGRARGGGSNSKERS